MKQGWMNITPEVWHPVVFNEAYFTNTPHLDNALRALSQLRAKYMSGGTYKLDIAIHTDPYLLQFNREMEEEFGFGSFSLIINTNINFNASTFPVGIRPDTNQSAAIIKTKNGYKYDKKADYCCIVFIFTGLLLNPRYTDREVMGVILHEVGHNFAGAVNKRIGVFEYIHKTFTLLGIIGSVIFMPFLTPLLIFFNTNAGMKAMIAIDKYMRVNYPTISKWNDYFNHMIGVLSSLQSEFNYMNRIASMAAIPLQYGGYIMGYLINKGKVIAVSPGMLLYTIYGYPHEKFSDNFAAMYGYGPEVASAFGKVETHHGLKTQEFVEDKVPAINAMENIIILPIRMICTSLDEHPVIIERSLSNIRVLKEELKYADPKVKKRINKDIALIEADIEKYYKINAKMKGSNIGNRAWYTVLYSLFGGDIRHHWMDALFKSKESLTSKADKEK